MAAHQSEFRRVWTLSAGLNSLATFLAAFAPNMPHRALEWTYQVESVPAGDTLAVGGSSMASVADGRQIRLLDAGREQNTDLTSVYFYDTAGGAKVSIFVRTK